MRPKSAGLPKFCISFEGIKMGFCDNAQKCEERKYFQFPFLFTKCNYAPDLPNVMGFEAPLFPTLFSESCVSKVFSFVCRGTRFADRMVVPNKVPVRRFHASARSRGDDCRRELCDHRRHAGVVDVRKEARDGMLM